jgi:ribonuclease G
MLVVNVTEFETRVALLDNGLVVEAYIERAQDRGIVGNIYLGKVQRVLPGMQAAFVEIGAERAAFLYVGDVVPHEGDDDHHHEEEDEANGANGEDLDHVEPRADDEDGREETARIPRRRRRRKRQTSARIEELLRPGQTVLVQVTKDAIGTKGPRITCNISLPGRQLVYMPTHNHIGVSRRITDEEERQRLRQILEETRPGKGGFVVRTVSAGLSREKLEADVEFLHSMWVDIEKRASQLGAPSLVQPELGLVLRSARDLFTAELGGVIVDDTMTFEQLKRFTSMLDKSLLPRLTQYEEHEPIFDHYGIETELARAMSRKVWLKSGGYLVIDQAEALTAIDVNTGRFVGKRNLEDTILRTNLEACETSAAWSSSTSSTWSCRTTATRCSRRCTRRCGKTARAPTSSSSASWASWR